MKKSKLLLILSFILWSFTLNAQTNPCADKVSLTTKVVDARCAQAGEVHITFTFEAGAVEEGNYSYMVTTRNDITETTFVPTTPQPFYYVTVGSYYVYVQYLCNLSGERILLRSGQLEVGRTYTPVTLNSNSRSYPSYNCSTGGEDKKYGRVSAYINNGRPPYRFVLTNPPAGYADVTDTIPYYKYSNGTINYYTNYTFRNLPAGNYTVNVYDSCLNVVPIPFEVLLKTNDASFTQSISVSSDANPFGTDGLGSASVGTYRNAGLYYYGNNTTNPGGFTSSGDVPPAVLTIINYPAGYKGRTTFNSVVYNSTGTTTVQFASGTLVAGNYDWEFKDPCGNLLGSGTVTVGAKATMATPVDYVQPTVQMPQYVEDAINSNGYATHPDNNNYCDNYGSWGGETDAYYQTRYSNDQNMNIQLLKKNLTTAENKLYSIYTYPRDFEIAFYENDGTLIKKMNLIDAYHVLGRCYDMMGWYTENVLFNAFPNMELGFGARYQRDSLLIHPERLAKATITNRFDTLETVFPAMDFPLTLATPSPFMTIPERCFREGWFRDSYDCDYTRYYSLFTSSGSSPYVYTSLANGNSFTNQPYTSWLIDTASGDTVYTYTATSALASNTGVPYNQRLIINPTVGNTYQLRTVDKYDQVIADASFTVAASGAPTITNPSISVSATVARDTCGIYPHKAYMSVYCGTYFEMKGKLRVTEAPAGAPIPIDSIIPITSRTTRLYVLGTSTSTSTGYKDLPAGTYRFQYTDTCGRVSSIAYTTLTYTADNPFIWTEEAPTIVNAGFDCTGTTYTISNWKDLIQSGPFTAANKNSTFYIRVAGPSGKQIGTGYSCCYDEWGGSSCPFVDWNLACEYGDCYSYCIDNISTANTVSFKVSNYTDSIRIKIYAHIQNASDTLLDCRVREYAMVLPGGFVEFDDEITGGYRCPEAEKGVGTIKARAKGGIGPFSYALFASRDSIVADLPLQSNTTGDFTGWPATGNDVFYIQITDEGCNNYKATGIVTLQDLGNAALLSVAGDPRKCIGDSAQLICVPLGDTDYTWYNSDKSWTAIGVRTPVVPASVLARGTDTYFCEIGIPQCYDDQGAPLVITRQIEISVAPTLMYWNPGAANKNWNNTANWVNQDGTPANAVPSPCTTVHVLADDGGTYPWLDQVNSPSEGRYGFPACDTIIYYHGAETVYPQYLQYSQARIRYNFGYYDGGFVNNAQPANNIDEMIYPNVWAPAPLQRAYWYSLATPLKKVTGGDFGVGPYPQIYQRAFMVVDPVGAVPGYNSFTKSFATANIDLSSGENYNALAIWMPPYRSADYRYSNQSTLEALGGNIEIPYFMNPGIMENLKYHEYDEASKTMSFIHYDYTKPPHEPTGVVDQIVRGKESFRFIYENQYNRLDSITYSGKRLEAYTMPIASESVGKSIMMGNPFMAHLNFDKLYEANSQTIENYYEIYDGGGTKTFNVYAPDVPGGATITTPYIKPLQAVVVKVKETPANNSIIFPMGGITEGYSVMSLNPGDTRSSQTRAAIGDKYGWIEMNGIVPPAASGNDSVRIQSKLIFNYEGTNKGKTIYPASYAEKAETFFIDASGTANMYQYEWTEVSSVKFGLHSQYTGKVRLSFEIKEDIPPSRVLLVDKYLDNLTVELSRDIINNYDFTHRATRVESGQTGLDTERFELRFVYTSVGIEDGITNDLLIFCDGIKLTVSSLIGIESVSLVDSQGRSLMGESGIGSVYYEKILSGTLPTGVYFVKVVLRDGSSEMKKIVIK